MEQKKQSSIWIDRILNDVRYWEDVKNSEIDELQVLFERDSYVDVSNSRYSYMGNTLNWNNDDDQN